MSYWTLMGYHALGVRWNQTINIYYNNLLKKIKVKVKKSIKYNKIINNTFFKFEIETTWTRI